MKKLNLSLVLQLLHRTVIATQKSGCRDAFRLIIGHCGIKSDLLQHLNHKFFIFSELLCPFVSNWALQKHVLLVRGQVNEAKSRPSAPIPTRTQAMATLLWAALK